jgi:hypothetical protein
MCKTLINHGVVGVCTDKENLYHHISESYLNNLPEVKTKSHSAKMLTDVLSTMLAVQDMKKIETNKVITLPVDKLMWHAGTA